MEKGFIIELKPAQDRQRPDGLLDFPSFGQEHEAFGEIGSFDDLDGTICGRLDGLYEECLVTAIDDDGLDPWTQAHQPLHQRDSAVLVLDVGGGDRHGKQAAAAVHRDMSFAAQHFLAGVISPLALRRVAFDRLRIDDGHGRTGLAPRLFPIRHHQMMVDPLHVTAIGQEPPVVVADARRRQVLGHGVPRDAIA